jgi:hypothetical protein
MRIRSEDNFKDPVRRVRLRRSVLYAVLVTFLVFLFHSQFTRSNYLLSDSADYLRAARSPFLQTYLNTDSASPVRLYKLRNDSAFRDHPWDYLYFHGDNAAIRHFHTPFSFYAMHAVSRLSSRDTNQRRLSSVVTAVTCGAVVIGLSIFEVPLIVAAGLGLVAGIQSRYIDVSVDPSPHSWYMLFAVLFLFTFAGYLQTRRLRVLLLSAVFLGFAFATLEFSLELVSSVPLALAVLWVTKRSALGNLKNLATSFVKALPVFCITTLILWPGGWFRGGYIESYGVTGATVLLKNKAAFGEHSGPADLYLRFFGGHEALLILAAFLLIASVVLLAQRKMSIASVVFISYTSVAFVLGIADHFRLDTYISEALLFALISTALLFQDMLTELIPVRRLAIVSALVVLALVGAQEWSRRQPRMFYQPWLKPILDGVSAEVPAGAVILVNDNLEAYSTYLPKYDYQPTMSISDLTPRIPGRTRGIHFLLFDDSPVQDPNTKLLNSFPTNIPGRTVKLYVENK